MPIVEITMFHCDLSVFVQIMSYGPVWPTGHRSLSGFSLMFRRDLSFSALSPCFEHTSLLASIELACLAAALASQLGDKAAA